MPIKVAIIANAQSGKGKAASAAKYVERLVIRRGIEASLNFTDSARRTSILARHSSFRFNKVIAVGGDGTINGVINGITGTNCKLGIIPTGSDNLLARELKIPEDIEQAAAIAVNGDEKLIDLGKVNHHYFSLMCGIGLDPSIETQIKPLIKKVTRKKDVSVAVKSIVGDELPEHLMIKIDNELISEGYFVIICNSKPFSGTRSVLRQIDFTDGFLDACIFKQVNALHYLRSLAAISAGKFSTKDAEYYRVKQLQIISDKPVLIQTDGDIVDQTPAEITVEHKSLRVMAPKS